MHIFSQQFSSYIKLYAQFIYTVEFTDFLK